ncbi:MAG TPA: hypothetical protein VGT03_09470 [Candidatus Acidoferrales bacterium]|nr:hypothetical protein [Candidatus Acidoferrales bacterium]
MSQRAKSDARCVICGCGEDVEENHVGGRNHVAWFTMPFCRKHHDQFHALLRAAGVDLTYTSDPAERLARAQKACLVFQWMLTEAQQELNSRSTNETEQFSRV